METKTFQIEFLEKGFLIGKRYYKYSNIIDVELTSLYREIHTVFQLYIYYGVEQRTLLYSTTHNQNDGSDKEREDASKQYSTMNAIYDTLLKKRDEYVRLQKR